MKKEWEIERYRRERAIKSVCVIKERVWLIETIVRMRKRGFMGEREIERESDREREVGIEIEIDR